MRGIWSWIVVPILLATISQAQTTRSAAMYLERGQDRYARGDLQGSIEDFGTAIRFEPDLAIAYSNRGLARWAKGDLDEASADLDLALALDPRLQDAYNARGCVWHAKGDLERAIADYTKAIGINSKYALAYYNRGNARMSKGDLDAAISDFDLAIANNHQLPKFLPKFYNNRGCAWQEKGNFDKAIGDFNKAIKMNPRLAMVYLNRGTSLLAEWREAEAERDFHRCIELDASLKDSVEQRSKQVRSVRPPRRSQPGPVSEGSLLHN